MSEFEKEERYVVFKITDIERCFTSNDLILLGRLSEKVGDLRQGMGKEPLDCVVIEGDWPIYDQAWEMVKRLAAGQNQEIDQLKEALRSILGWRELRDTNDIPIERIEYIATTALDGDDS